MRVKRMWKKRAKAGKRLNNSGMSLVEVIVAMTIFAIVTVPVLHALTTSAVYNQKARRRQNVTALAESVMENFKGYSIDSLENEVFHSGIAGAEMLGLEIAEDTDIGFAYEDAAKKDSAITFQINKVKSDNKEYNIEIKATPSVKEEEIFEIDNASEAKDAIYEDKTPYNADIYEKVKGNFLSKAWAINDMILGDDKRDENGNLYTVETLDRDKIKITKREMLYKIRKEGDKYVVMLSAAYIYQLQNHECYMPYETPSAPPPTSEPDDENSGTIETEAPTETESEPQLGDWVLEPEDKWFQSFVHYMDLIDTTGAHDGYDIIENIAMHDIPIYDSKNGTHDERDDTILDEMSKKNIIYRGKDLKRLIIYYFPAYKGETGYDENFRDVIKIDNQTDLELDCYLIKQKNPNLTETKLTLKEQGYAPVVRAKGTKMRLFHNLDENLGRRTGTAKNHIQTSEFKIVENYTGSDAFKKKKVMTYELDLKVTDTEGHELTKLRGTMYEKYREYEADAVE